MFGKRGDRLDQSSMLAWRSSQNDTQKEIAPLNWSPLVIIDSWIKKSKLERNTKPHVNDLMQFQNGTYVYSNGCNIGFFANPYVKRLPRGSHRNLKNESIYWKSCLLAKYPSACWNVREILQEMYPGNKGSTQHWCIIVKITWKMHRTIKLSLLPYRSCIGEKPTYKVSLNYLDELSRGMVSQTL